MISVLINPNLFANNEYIFTASIVLHYVWHLYDFCFCICTARFFQGATLFNN